MSFLSFYYVVLALAALASIFAWYQVARFGITAADSFFTSILPTMLFMLLLGLNFHPAVSTTWSFVSLAMIIAYWAVYFALGKRHVKKQAQKINHFA